MITARNQILFWIAAFAGFVGFVFVFKSVLLPFVLGIAIAYLLNPMVRGLGKINVSRGPAALIILSGFLLFAAVFLAFLLPVLYRQLFELVQNIPAYKDQVLALIEPLSAQIKTALGVGQDTD
ncbi:MAG: AI-2E family transporter, partial [Bdellovibrionales bacterium]